MGKAKKTKVSKGETKEPKIGLAEQLELDKTVKPKNRQKIRFRADEEEVNFHIYLCVFFLFLLLLFVSFTLN